MKNLHSMPLDIKSEYLTQALIEAYHSPIRHYHTLLHALRVATVAKELLIISESDCNYQRLMDTYLAGLWHDAVYDVASKSNEKYSAILFNSHYPYNSNVARLINGTTVAHHLSEQPVDIQMACLLDADLLSLSLPFVDFIKTQQLIREESKSTSRDGSKPTLTRSAQSEFLMKFLDKSSIYHTEYCQAHHEAIARENIKSFQEYCTYNS